MNYLNLINKKNISLLLFFFINFLFGIKYLSRISEFYIPITFLIILFYIFVLKKFNFINTLLDKTRLTIKMLLTLYIISSLVLFYLIPKETLNVDRWSVITSFWDNYFSDKYVYFAKSFDGNYPGPMPFYFILALPFYWIGELGLYSLLGIVLFVYLTKLTNKNKEYSKIVFLLIATSLFYIWEISTRSNIFSNGTIVLISIYFFLKRYTKTVKNNILFGIAFGLVLLTRNVYAIPLIITIMFSIKTKKLDFYNLIQLGLYSLVTFIFTFIPFIWNHFEDFKVMNPFIIQSSFLMPFEYTIVFITASFLSFFVVKNEFDVYFYSGIILFCTILFYFAYTISITSFTTTFFKSAADISYFILCLPFILFHFSASKDLA